MQRASVRNFSDEGERISDHFAILSFIFRGSLLNKWLAATVSFRL
jgi:hypothetical protein